ncbi:MAG: N-acetylmuramoyl-L-alanine amidase [Flavobacteriales bacterium]|nr:N-acetylmuramoyl-L-alanine amidase [Flavobacteriales bacterium]
MVGVNNFSFSQSAEKQIRTIVIDAGHGGKDPGTMGTKRYKIYEKDIALEVSLILGRYIEKKFPEIKVVYTRKKDVFLELWERTELANKNDADLFISIHCDGFKNSDASGASVFVMGMSKLKANMDVAMRENSVMYLEDNFKEKYDGFDPKSAESYIVFSLMQNTYLEQSISFAQQLDIQFVERVYRKSRGVKQAPFYVISRVNMPSVLIELGFLTNPDEEDFLHSENGQIYMASAIFRAFKEYKETVDGLLVIDTDDSNEDFKEIEILENKDLKEELNIVFKIQLGTYLKSMKNSSVFDGMNVEEDLTNGTYRYFLSLGNDKKEADKLKLKHRSGKFAGAFIVAFYNEKQISVKEALDLLNK